MLSVHATPSRQPLWGFPHGVRSHCGHCGDNISDMPLCLSCSKVSTMSDDHAFDHEDDVFRDICGVVSHSLDVTRCGEKVQRRLDEVRRGPHDIMKF
jgi:hypothetical protein